MILQTLLYDTIPEIPTMSLETSVCVQGKASVAPMHALSVGSYTSAKPLSSSPLAKPESASSALPKRPAAASMGDCKLQLPPGFDHSISAAGQVPASYCSIACQLSWRPGVMSSVKKSTTAATQCGVEHQETVHCFHVCALLQAATDYFKAEMFQTWSCEAIPKLNENKVGLLPSRNSLHVCICVADALAELSLAEQGIACPAFYPEQEHQLVISRLACCLQNRCQCAHVCNLQSQEALPRG